MQNGDEASPSIILAGRALLVKMIISLEPHGIFDSNFPATAIQNGDEASSIIILAGRALLVKMLITLETRGKFTSNLVSLCTLTLSHHCHAKRWRGVAEHHFGRSNWLLYINYGLCILLSVDWWCESSSKLLETSTLLYSMFEGVDFGFCQTDGISNGPEKQLLFHLKTIQNIFVT